MDARIILAGQPVDLVGAMRQGNAAAIETNALRQNNQLTDLYRQQGAGLLAGDQGAMNALAGVDPGLAMGFKADQQAYAQNNRKMEILNAEEKRVIEDRAALMTAAERAAAAAEIEDAVKMGMAIPDAATWDQTMAQVAPEMVGQFGNRQALAFKYMSVAEVMKASQAPDPTEGAPSGYMWTDPRNRGAGVTPLPGVEAKPADDYGRYVQEETAAGRQPLDRISYAQALKGAGFEVISPDGTVIRQGGAAGAGGKATEGQLAGAGYLQRMVGAQAILDGLEAKGTTSIPLQKTLLMGTGVEGFVMSAEEASLAQAMRDWVRAKLRKESGAVIGTEEMADEVRTYFPLPGEGPEIIAQKREARRRAERQMQITAGSAADQAGELTPAPGETPAPAAAPSPAITIDGYTIEAIQ